MWDTVGALGAPGPVGEVLNGQLRPCFNSTLNDSMSLLYRPLGHFVRPIGQHRGDGEQLHRSVLDRLALKECGYAPPNLTPDLLAGAGALPVADTTYVARGIPCEPAAELPALR